MYECHAAQGKVTCTLCFRELHALRWQAMLTMATQVVLALLLLVWSAEAQRRPVISGGGGHGGQVAGPGVVRGGLGGGFRHRRNFNQAYPYVLGSYGWPGSYGDFGCAGSEPEYSQEGPEPQRS